MNLPNDLLDINPHMQVTIQHVGRGDHRVVIVDQFYQSQEKVLQVALDLPYTDRFEIVGNFPGVRASIHLDTTQLIRTISEL